VAVRTGVDQVDLQRSIAIDADLIAAELVRFVPRDWRARRGR
jgi:hypothetical protein